MAGLRIEDRQTLAAARNIRGVQPVFPQIIDAGLSNVMLRHTARHIGIHAIIHARHTDICFAAGEAYLILIGLHQLLHTRRTETLQQVSV